MDDQIIKIIAGSAGTVGAITASVYMVVRSLVKKSVSEDIDNLSNCIRDVEQRNNAEVLRVHKSVAEGFGLIKSEMSKITREVKEITGAMKEMEVKEENRRNLVDQLNSIQNENAKAYSQSRFDKACMRFIMYKAEQYKNFVLDVREIDFSVPPGDVMDVICNKVDMYQTCIINMGQRIFSVQVMADYYKCHSLAIKHYEDALEDIVHGPNNHKILYLENEAKSFLRRFMAQWYIWTRKNHEYICKESGIAVGDEQTNGD